MSRVIAPQVGHLGQEELAAASLGNIVFSMLQHPCVGCATALDTLLAQAREKRERRRRRGASSSGGRRLLRTTTARLTAARSTRAALALAQSHGARNDRAFGGWLRIGIAVLLAMCVPFGAALAAAGPLLVATGQAGRRVAGRD